jgi:LysM repeat protein
MARVEVLNPFRAAATVTTSSLQGHHVPYGGTMSCDMDVDTDSRGTPVFFRVATNGPALRGRVESVRPACRSGELEDGGNVIVVALEREGGEATGLRVAYAHIDPVAVGEGDELDAGGTLLGSLGPEQAQDWGPERGKPGHLHPAGDPRRAEYHSSCAVHSHLHLEGFGAETVMRAQGRPSVDEPLMSFTGSGAVEEPEVVVEAGASLATHVEVATSVAVEVPAAEYTVQEGESLLEIAGKLGVPLAALVAANDGLVVAGEVLTLPGQVYVVRPRDRLVDIALRFGVTLQALIDANAIANPNVIEVGQVLQIPR